MTKWNKFFLMTISIMALGLSACGSIERNTASSHNDDQYIRPYLADR